MNYAPIRIMNELTVKELNDIDIYDFDIDQLKPNEAIIVEVGNGRLGLLLCCPKCGHTSTGPHIYRRESRSLVKADGSQNSTVCSKCDFHMTLVNGEWK